MLNPAKVSVRNGRISEMGSPSPSPDTATLIVALGTFITAVAAVIGKGISWTVKLRRSRITELERRMDRLQEECSAERLEATRKIDVLVTVCIVLIDGGSHSTARAKQLLGTEFPDLLRRVYPAESFIDTPDDLSVLAAQARETMAKPTPRRRRAKP